MGYLDDVQLVTILCTLNEEVCKESPIIMIGILENTINTSIMYNKGNKFSLKTKIKIMLLRKELEILISRPDIYARDIIKYLRSKKHYVLEV